MSSGGMKPGSRDEQGTRLWAEQQFKEGAFQILVATEAVLFNCDIPWNPNHLEKRAEANCTRTGCGKRELTPASAPVFRERRRSRPAAPC